MFPPRSAPCRIPRERSKWLTAVISPRCAIEIIQRIGGFECLGQESFCLFWGPMVMNIAAASASAVRALARSSTAGDAHAAAIMQGSDVFITMGPTERHF